MEKILPPAPTLQGDDYQLISDPELSESTRMVKEIERVLKGQLKGKSTDSIWKDAFSRNQQFDLHEGDRTLMREIGESPFKPNIIETVKANATQNFSAAKSDCGLFKSRLEGHFESVVGKQTPRKNF